MKRLTSELSNMFEKPHELEEILKNWEQLAMRYKLSEIMDMCIVRRRVLHN